MREDFDFRRQHVEARPARTYSVQAALAERNSPQQERRNPTFAVPVRELSARSDAPIRFERIGSEKRQAINSKAKELDRFRAERVKRETKNEKTDKYESKKVRTLPEPRKASEQTGVSKPTREETKHAERIVDLPEPQRREESPPTRSEANGPERVKISKSPVVGKRADAPGRSDTPPGRPAEPRPDRNIPSKPEDESKHESMDRNSAPIEAPVSNASEAPKDKNQNEKGNKKDNEKDNEKGNEKDNEKDNEKGKNRDR